VPVQTEMTVLPGEPGRMVRGMRNVTDTLFCLHSARCQMPGHPHSHAYNRTSSRTQGLVLAFPLVSCIPQMTGLASVCVHGEVSRRLVMDIVIFAGCKRPARPCGPPGLHGQHVSMRVV